MGRVGYTADVFAQTTTHTTLLARLGDSKNPEAWDEFCARYGDLIRGFAVRQGLQPADCDDCVQDVLLKLTGSLPRFQYDPAKGKFRSYLKTVVVHAVYERFARKARSEKHVDIAHAAATDDADPAVEQAWELEWRRYHLGLAMKRVEAEFSRRDIRAFEAYAVQGVAAQTVAAEMNMSVDQVYQAKSQILKRVSAFVAEQVADEG